MWKVASITEQFQHFGTDLKETLGGEVYGEAQVTWQKFLGVESARRRDRYVGCGRYAQQEGRRGWRNGFYFRDFVSGFGTPRLQITRRREQAFLPGAVERFQRRAAAVMLLIREAFLRGISTCQVGRGVAILTGDAVSTEVAFTAARSCFS